MALIDVDTISFSYGEHAILSDISLSVEAGSIVGLLGPNGTGKSTLLGIMSGDLQPDSGRVRLDGRELTTYDRRELALKRSVMPQAHEFPFSYLVADIVAMGRASHPNDGCSDEEIIYDAMCATGVDHLADRDVTTLSGGEKARVTLARVLAQDAELVLLDEPTAALDIAHQQQTMGICSYLAEEGKGVVAVMHDIQLSAASCDLIALMSEGKIVAYGSPSDVLTSERLSQVYGWTIRVDYLSDGTLVIVPS